VEGVKRTRSDLIRVGLFVVVATAILAGGLLWIAGSRLLRPVDTYTVVFKDSVSGLNAGSNVEYQGVVVGRVRAIGLTGDLPPMVAVVIDLEPGTPVRADTEAALVGSLVTGLQYIQLHGGTGAAEPLPEGGTLRGDTRSLEEFRARASRIADLAVTIMSRLEKNVFTEENTEKLSTVLTDLNKVAGGLSTTIESFRTEGTGADLAQLVAKLTEMTDNLNLVVKDFYGRRDDFYGNFRTTLKHVDEVVVDARKLVQATTSQVGGTSGSLGTLMQELTAATNRLQETLDVIRSDPSVLLWGRSVPEREFEE
jgi:phospholipid/cholesterol/gamma-HCH transport system substrate-binding protein